MKKKVLDDLREGCKCQSQKYCPLEVFVQSIGSRHLEQHKCVEMFKLDEGRRVGRGISWDEAYKLWVDRGHAKRFGEVYKEGMHPVGIYNQIMPKGHQVNATNQITL